MVREREGGWEGEKERERERERERELMIDLLAVGSARPWVWRGGNRLMGAAFSKVKT